MVRNEPPYEGMVEAPFTAEQAAALNRYQHAGKMHPFTCPREHVEGVTEGGSPSLVACPGAGWVCSEPFCDYTQKWAHPFMLEPELGDAVVSEADRLRSILERLVAELHDASQVSGGNNMIRSEYLLEIIGDAVECPDCKVALTTWHPPVDEATLKEEQEQQTDRDIVELTERVAESDAEAALDEKLRRRPHQSVNRIRKVIK